jgi:MFS family permease
VRLFKVRAFSASALTVLLFATAFFGSQLLLPLFFQVARGESALDAGLLTAPQGIGAALAMPIAGRLTDRIGGGRVALFGIIAMVLTTIPLALLTGGTSLVLIEGVLFLRGVALGCSMMPSMAAAYATLERAAVPRATSALNVIQRVGGSIGTAVLAVVLSHQIVANVPGAAAGGGLEAAGSIPDAARGRLADPLAHAFGGSFWWAVALTAVAIVPAVVLALTGRQRTDAPAPAAVAGD